METLKISFVVRCQGYWYKENELSAFWTNSSGSDILWAPKRSRKRISILFYLQNYIEYVSNVTRHVNGKSSFSYCI